MASCVVLCRDLGACGYVSAMEEEWPLLCTNNLYNLLRDFRTRKKTSSGMKKDGYCGQKLALLSQVFANIWHPVFTVNDFSSSLLLCNVVVDSLTPSSQWWSKTFWLMNNWWSHCSTISLLWLVAHNLITSLLYKEARKWRKGRDKGAGGQEDKHLSV